MAKTYRVIIEHDADGQDNQEGCDGESLPEAPDVYADNEVLKDGKAIPYEEYVKYYGNPDRHVILMFCIQAKCGECGQWKTVESLCNVDFMDDSDDAYRTGTYDMDEVRSWPVKSYLRSEILEMLPE